MIGDVLFPKQLQELRLARVDNHLNVPELPELTILRGLINIIKIKLIGPYHSWPGLKNGFEITSNVRKLRYQEY